MRIDAETGFFFIDYTANTLARALLYGIFVYLPVILILGFFSNRVNMHLEELASEWYERRIVVVYVLPDSVRPVPHEKD